MHPGTATFRSLALALPNAIESAHMGHPDFRVLCADGKLRIFATLPGEHTDRGVLKLTLEQQASFCAELPRVFEPVQGGWGRMGMTCVHLDAAGEDVLLGALTTAHTNVLSSVGASKARRVPANPGRKKTVPANRVERRGPERNGPKIKS